MLMRSPTATPSLESLSYILRHEELWPDGFVWDFGHHRCCALGMAHKMWPYSTVIAIWASMPGEQHTNIFIEADTKPKVGRLFKRNRRHDEVTPAMVADQIDDYLAAV